MMLWHAAVAALLAGAIGAGAGWQARGWKADADDLARVREEGAARVRQMDRSIEASAAHETERAKLARDLSRARHDIKTALQRPALCPAGPDGQPGALADLVIPAGALDGLRRAAGAVPPGPAASQPGRPVQPRPGHPGR